MGRINELPWLCFIFIFFLSTAPALLIQIYVLDVRSEKIADPEGEEQEPPVDPKLAKFLEVPGVPYHPLSD